MKTKKMRLQQAKKAGEFMSSIDEANAWMAEAEESVKSDDLGKDVETAKALLKKQATLETELYQQVPFLLKHRMHSPPVHTKKSEIIYVLLNMHKSTANGLFTKSVAHDKNRIDPFCAFCVVRQIKLSFN
jgi:hypothetical protein